SRPRKRPSEPPNPQNSSRDDQHTNAEPRTMSDSKSADQRELRTVVEQGTRIKGTLASSCPMDVHGHVEGEVEAPALYVSATGALHGRAKVGTIRWDGALSGELEAEHLELAGRVLDQTVIRARSLQVNLASDSRRLQVVFGECELSVGDEPAERELEAEAPVAAEAAAEAEAEPPIAAAPSESGDAPRAMEAESAEAPPMLPAAESEQAAHESEMAAESAASASEAMPSAEADAAAGDGDMAAEASASSEAEANGEEAASMDGSA